MNDAFICDAIRTPFGKYGGALSSIRTDDLAALPIAALMQRNQRVEWGSLDDVIYGCANQAGEDNRNVARMALLLAGLPKDEALRKAMAELARNPNHPEWSHPFFWAPFLLVGDPANGCLGRR